MAAQPELTKGAGKTAGKTDSHTDCEPAEVTDQAGAEVSDQAGAEVSDQAGYETPLQAGHEGSDRAEIGKAKKVTEGSENIRVVDRAEVTDHEPSHRRSLALLLVGAVAATLAVAVLALPREKAPLPAIARYAMVVALPQWHTTEPVSEIVYGTRGFDTFGETFLLLAAVVGTTTIARARERRRGFIGEELAGLREQRQIGDPSARDLSPANAIGQAEARRAEAGEQGGGHPVDTPDDTPLGTPGPETAEAMSVVVRAAVRAVAPILGISGLYLVAWGYSPGGGFPAGAVLLGLVLFIYVAYGYRRVQRVVRPDVIEPLELSGAVAIIAIEALGFFLRGSFSSNFLPLGPVGTIRSGGILQAFSGAELIEVSTGLTLAIFGLLGMRHDWSQDEADVADVADVPDVPDVADVADMADVAQAAEVVEVARVPEGAGGTEGDTDK